jgi:hypothetical protein
MYAYVGNDPSNLVDPSGLLPPPPPPDPCSNPDNCGTVTGPRRICTGGLIQIGNVCVSGADLDTVIFSRTSFSFVTQSIPNIGPGVDCRARGRQVTCQLPRAQSDQCSGPVVTWSPLGVAGTLFYKFSGIRLGAGLNLSLPGRSLANGSLRGLQISLSASRTSLSGFGFFAGGGPGQSFGMSGGPLAAGPSRTEEGALSGALAWAEGMEGTVSGTGDSMNFQGNAGPRIGYGGYAGGGTATSWNIATSQMGCN